MSTREELLNDFYVNHCDEDERLESKSQQLEFLTTDQYIQKYLEPGDRILEVGTGTGKYSLHYARKGYKVNAIEYVQHNLDILQDKITDNMAIVAEQGDAIDLSRFADDTFDLVLVLGPLYHLYTPEEINKCISEAKRVCKTSGIIMFAYIPNDSIMISWALLKGNLVNGRNNGQFDENFRMSSDPHELFKAFYIDEFEGLMQQHNIQKLNNIATAGIAPHFRSVIDELTDEEFKVWKEYHFNSCERKELQGYSTHMLYIGRKC
jgi:ubiquinone/menaquinone biosynthesis C-methylase UbiE